MLLLKAERDPKIEQEMSEKAEQVWMKQAYGGEGSSSLGSANQKPGAQQCGLPEPLSPRLLLHSPPPLSSLYWTSKTKDRKKSPLVKCWRRAEFVFLSDGGVEGCVSTTCQTTISLLTSLLLFSTHLCFRSLSFAGQGLALSPAPPRPKWQGGGGVEDTVTAVQTGLNPQRLPGSGCNCCVC